MSREVRKVPADWQHPKDGFYSDGQPRYVALFDGTEFEAKAAAWDVASAKWAKGEYPEHVSEKSKAGTYEDWADVRPDPDWYMPVWPENQRTHFMMYETITEGTPISPAFPTMEELARWLTDNDASGFAGDLPTYEEWLEICKYAFPFSTVIDSDGIHSGVKANSRRPKIH